MTSFEQMNRIKEVLDEKGIKQTWLAEQLGKNYNMVNAYVQNRQQPRIELLYEIAEILGVNVKELLIDNEIKKDKKMSNEQKITTDIKVPNKDLEILRSHFPYCFDKDGKFDFAKFQKELEAQNVELSFEKESYGLDWLGKSYARLLASDPATTLLKADETHNQKPENKNSQNLLIKGDNLEVLKHLANAYYEKVKMIYIDPPYNTGSDGFVYNDDRKYTVEQLQGLLGIDTERAKRILDFTQSKSNSHSAWLTFMYPRLYIAKQLLREDGVIFVSIDDNEVAQLRLLMDEVFGEDNFRNLIVIKRGVKSVQAQFEKIDKLGIAYEFILVYTKNPNLKFPQFYFHLEERKEGSWNNHWRGTDRPSMRYELLGCRINQGQWRWSKERSEQAVLNYKKLLSDLKKENPTQAEIDKWYEENGRVDLLRLSKSGKPEHYVSATDKKIGNNLWIDLLASSADALSKLGMDYFDNPKSPSLISRICQWVISDTSDLILDFFAGSGTTGDAVMQLNAEDDGNRKYILVQLPEPIEPKKNQTAYNFVKNELKAEPTIFEITKERLIRSAKKIKTETIDKKITEKEKELQNLQGELNLEDRDEKINTLKQEIENLKNQDLGFKIFETMPIWEDYDFEAETFDSSQTLFDTGKLTEDDLKALLITWKTYDGMPLTEDLETITLDGYPTYYGNEKLYLMHKGFTTNTLKALLEKIDSDKHFEPKSIIAFGYHFESARLRELSENVKNYANKKHIDIEFIIRY